MPLSADQFAKAVINAGLSSAEEIKSLWAALPAGTRPKDGETFSKVLVEREKLTQFQAAELLAGSTTPLVLGDYVLLAKIGAGGMGQVFKAQHRHMKRLVAIKLLPTALTKDPEAVKRFQREVEAAAKLAHPNIVQAYDASVLRGVWYLVMEYVEGRDLSVVVADQGPLPIERAVEYIRQAAKGLAFAHENGVVHRDIKPANLLLDKKGTVKILDMGLARFEDGAAAAKDGLTQSGQVMGTIDYMAPEQAFDTHAADARADIYSLGCTLYRLLTGANLFEGETLVQKLLAHQQQPAPDLSQRRADAPRELDAIFRNMVAKKPEDRYQSMTEVEAVLATLLAGVAASSSAVAPDAGSKFSNFFQTFNDQGKQTQPAAAGVSTLARPDAATRPSSGDAATITLASPLQVTDPVSQRSVQIARGPTPQPTGAKKPPIWRQPLVVAIGGLGSLLLLAALVFFVQTKDGLIRVEINDPQIEVAIKGTNIVLKQADQGKDVEVSPGEKTLVVRRGDFTFETNKLILKSKDTVTVHVELLAGQVEVKQGDKVIGQAKLPAVRLGWPADAPPQAIAPFDAAQAKKHQEEWATYLKVPVEHTNSIGMKFRLIPPGEFTMGISAATLEQLSKTQFYNDPQRALAQRVASPDHRVRITRPFYMQVNEVGVKMFENVMNRPAPKQPMESGKDFLLSGISWYTAIDFCNQLSKREGWALAYATGANPQDIIWRNSASGARLPTEAEWEYACRAGTETILYFGDDSVIIEDKTALLRQHQSIYVDSPKANPFGLIDLYGGSSEWCWDAIGSENYSAELIAQTEDPVYHSDSPTCVLRGGTFFDGGGGDFGLINSFYRGGGIKDGAASGFGRVVIPVESVRQSLQLTGPPIPLPASQRQPPNNSTPRPK